MPAEPATVRFGKYEVLEELGRGAWGVIYKARDPHIDRFVAVKALVRDGGDAEKRKRFRFEAKVAGQLSHENVVKVYDLGEEGGVPYIAMEYLEGTDLRTIIRDRIELLAEKKLQILVQIARGLAYAHERGVVHRDVKPENVRVLDDGTVKLVDFGIATRVDVKDQPGSFHGTIAYMAPERLEGKEATPSSDLWALGVVAYELLTFHYPYPADNYAALMDRIVQGIPLEFEKSHALVHPRLQLLVARLLDRDSTRRHRSADEVVEELEEFMSGDDSRRKEAQVIFERALASYRAGTTREAIRLWELTLTLEPDHHPARTHLRRAREKVTANREAKLLSKLATFYLEMQVNDKALLYYREVLRVDPHDVAAQEAVRMLGGLGDLAPATAAAVRPQISTKTSTGSFRLPPPPAAASPELRRAVALVKKERIAEGMAILRDLLDRSPKDTMVHDYLVRVVRRIRKRVFAEKELVQKYIERGNACFRTENFQDAEEAWNKVLAIDDANLVARKNLEVLSSYVRGKKAEEDITYPEGQRFHRRVPGGFPCRYRGLFAPRSGARDAILHRLSVSGISLLTDEPVGISAVLELVFRLPGRNQDVEVLAQAIHAVQEPFGRHLIGTILLLVPEPYVEYLKDLQNP